MLVVFKFFYIYKLLFSSLFSLFLFFCCIRLQKGFSFRAYIRVVGVFLWFTIQLMSVAVVSLTNCVFFHFFFIFCSNQYLVLLLLFSRTEKRCGFICLISIYGFLLFTFTKEIVARDSKDWKWKMKSEKRMNKICI